MLLNYFHNNINQHTVLTLIIISNVWHIIRFLKSRVTLKIGNYTLKYIQMYNVSQYYFFTLFLIKHFGEHKRHCKFYQPQIFNGNVGLCIKMLSGYLFFKLNI